MAIYFMWLTQDLIQEKPWMLRIHSVLYSKVTPVYFFYMYIRSQHPEHEITCSRLYYCLQNNVLVNINSNQKLDLNILCSVSWIWVYSSHFPHDCPTRVKEMLALHKSHSFTLSHNFCKFCAIFTMWTLPCILGYHPVWSL
jgi:hypothetical protein